MTKEGDDDVVEDFLFGSGGAVWENLELDDKAERIDTEIQSLEYKLQKLEQLKDHLTPYLKPGVTLREAATAYLRAKENQ